MFRTFDTTLTGRPFSSLTSPCSISGSRKPIVPRWMTDAMIANNAFCSSSVNSIIDKASFTCLKLATSLRDST